MKEKTAQERLVKAEAKLEKLNKTLSKYLIRLQKVYEQYSKKTELHKILPFDLFVNFNTVKYYNWQDELDAEFALQKEFFKNHVVVYIHNIPATKHLVNSERNAEVDLLMRDTNELADSIVRKRMEIEEVEKTIENYKEVISKHDSNKRVVDELFKQVPQLKEFIEKTGDMEYAYLIDHNKAIKEAWDRYYKADRECCELWNTGHVDDYREKIKEVKKMKPKVYPKTEQQINDDVESWKRNEGLLMAERIQTEFGEVKNADLYIGADGNVNGIIYGTKRSARINTIFAGGYNIQCLHTRLLVHEK